MVAVDRCGARVHVGSLQEVWDAIFLEDRAVAQNNQGNEWRVGGMGQGNRCAPPDASVAVSRHKYTHLRSWADYIRTHPYFIPLLLPFRLTLPLLLKGVSDVAHKP